MTLKDKIVIVTSFCSEREAEATIGRFALDNYMIMVMRYVH
jgi:hypothetical protein